MTFSYEDENGIFKSNFSKMKTYVFWSKKGNNKAVWTELKAESVEAVKEWAEQNNVKITSEISEKK